MVTPCAGTEVRAPVRATLAPMGAPRPVEAALVASILGSALAVGVPAFLRNLHASRLVEPIDGLSRIAARATALAVAEPAASAYPAGVGLTPASVPRGTAVEDPPGTWGHPTWRRLAFAPAGPHRFAFAFASASGAGRSTFRAVAHGDLDGDGVTSTFERTGEVQEGAAPTVGPLELDRAVE